MVSAARVSVDTQTKVDFGLELGQLTEAVTVTAAEGQLLKTDRADVATTFDARAGHRAADPGPQLHQAHPAHPGHPAAELEPRGQREPAGIDADGGERADLQRHRLPARRHGQPRPHPRHHRHQPEPGGDRRDQDHLPELRRRVRPGHRGRRLGADQVRAPTSSTAASSSSCSATGSRPATRSRSRTGRTRSPDACCPRPSATSSAARSAAPSCRTSSSSSPTTRAPARTIGGSKLLTVPTARRAHRRPERVRREHLRSRGRRARVAAAVRRQRHPGQPAVAAGAAHPASSSRCPTRPGDNGTRDNFIAQGSEKFNADSGDIRLDGRLSDRLNTFVRYSMARLRHQRPARPSGRAAARSSSRLGGMSEVRNHSVALGADFTLNSTTVLDVRFGFFKYGVNVLPNDFGTTPAADAGIPGLNLGDDFTSGLPVHRAQRRHGADAVRLRPGRRPLQLPARRSRRSRPRSSPT